MQLIRGLLISLLLCVPLHAQFSTDFNNENLSCSGCYGMALNFPPDSNWTYTHLTTGGWNSSGAPQITLEAGLEQYEFGWGYPTNTTFSNGESIFWRLRFKWATSNPATTHDHTGGKFLSIGGISDGTDATTRTILWLGTREAGLCALQYGTNPTTGSGYNESGFFTYHQPSDYGGSGSWDGRSFGFSLNRNVEGSAMCASPPILVQGNGVTQLTPGYSSQTRFSTFTGALPVDGWYHIQIEARCGTAGNAYFKQWANENDYAEPTSLMNPIRYFSAGTPAGLACTDWTGGNLGFFWDDMPDGSDLSYIIDDFQMSKSYDSAWYPDGAAATPPVRLRFRAADLVFFLGVPLGCLCLARRRHASA